jgi:hypothetical protein
MLCSVMTGRGLVMDHWIRVGVRTEARANQILIDNGCGGYHCSSTTISIAFVLVLLHSQSSQLSFNGDYFTVLNFPSFHPRAKHL